MPRTLGAVAHKMPSQPRKTSMTFWSKQDPVKSLKVIDERVAYAVVPPYRIDCVVQGGTKRNYRTDDWSKLRVMANTKVAKKIVAAKPPSTEAEEEMVKYDLDVPPYRWSPEGVWLIAGEGQNFDQVVYNKLCSQMPGDISHARPAHNIKREWWDNPYYMHARLKFKYWFEPLNEQVKIEECKTPFVR